MKISAKMPLIGNKTSHLRVTSEEIAPIVLLPGDPGRVHLFKNLCSDFEIKSENREYVVGTGTYKGIPITVCSTGIGAASTEIAVIELIHLGAKALIRIGGTGVLKKEVNCGDMVITTGAMRLGGSSQFYAPLEYPAVASFEVINCLVESCNKHKVDFNTGISASVGSFFAGQARETLGLKFYEDNLLDEYKKLNILNMEMESETILTLGNIFNVYTGSICAVHANRITDQWLYEFEPYQLKMCSIALDASVKLYNDYIK